MTESSCETLAYGEFYGVFKYRHEIPDFSLALIVPDAVWLKGVRHSHQSTHMIFVLDGPYVLSAGGQERTLPPRSLIFVPAGTTHQNYPQKRTKVLTVSISDAQVERASDYIQLPEAESDFRHGEIGQLATRLEAECGGWHNASPLTAAGLCLELLGAAATRTAVRERKPPRWLQTAKELLHDTCCETVSIAEVANAAGVHPIHLCRTFRRFFHCTPGDYLRQCRIEKAASLLRFGHRSIAQVACESGFGDQSQLSKAFRRKLGITPAEFRLSASSRA
jgi:AraC family transcriptional regulator